MADSPTLRQVAELAHVSVSTASRSLAGRPGISRDNTERVLAAAQALGYQRNRLLGEVMSAARRGGTQTHLGSLGYLCLHADGQSWRRDPTLHAHWAAARPRAASLGFKLEDFVLYAEGMSEQRLCDILLSRGIQGVLIAPFPGRPRPLRLKWDHLAAVCMGHESREPRLDCVLCRPDDCLLVSMDKLRESGHRRVGLALERYQDEIIHRGWSRAFASSGSPVRPLLPAQLERDGFLDWVRQERPDAILSLSSFRGEASPMRAWLLEAGLEVPHDLSLASLDITDFHPGWGGMHQNSAEVGAAAAELLIAKLKAGAYGLPAVARSLHIHGEWRTGDTIRDR
jgi:LacI family transcriptional regulator